MTLPDEPIPADVTLLDTAQAKIGAGLRALFDPVMQAEVPANLASLAETLEGQLGTGPDQSPEPGASTTAQPSSPAKDI